MAGETRIHPAVAVELRKLQDDIDSYAAETERLSRELANEQAAREALERREVHIDDMPGKQLPFKYQINIALEGGSQAAQTSTVSVSRDGPFIARRLYATVTVTDAPILVDGATTYDYSHMIGRFVPRSSRLDYQNWAMPAVSITPAGYVPPPLDFEWEYNDGGSERNRQDKPISGDILALVDEDGYFMNNEIFAAGTTISFTVHPLRQVPILELGTDEGPLDLLFKVTFDGFKVLQPLEM
jgi:hypothetical protein